MASTKPIETMMSDEANAVVYQGASLSQLVAMFKMDIRKVRAKIADLEPCGKRGGFPIYSVKEAARYLVEPIWPIDEYVKRMNHADLPMLLRKEYWAGMRSRQLYEMAAGDLWATDKVIEHVSEILKTIAMSARLMSDGVEREAGLTVQQRAIVTRLNDEMIANANRELQKMIEKRKQDASAHAGNPDQDDDEL